MRVFQQGYPFFSLWAYYRRIMNLGNKTSFLSIQLFFPLPNGKNLSVK